MDYLKIYVDFVDIIEPLDDAETGRLFVAMLRYTASGVEPEFAGNERFVWPVARQNIDRINAYVETQRKKGTLGGRPKSQQKPAKAASSPNSNNNYNNNTNINENIYPPTPFEAELQTTFYRWMDYKRERGEPYTVIGLQALLAQIDNNAKQYGAAAVSGIINLSMANDWKSIIFDKLLNEKQSNNTANNVFLELSKEEDAIP